MRLLANLLTALRLLLIAPMAWLILEAQWVWASAAFVAAVLTDLLDGPAARRAAVPSPLGGLFDHGTDAALVIASLACLAWLGMSPAVLPAVIAAAFAQYVLDSGAERGRPLRASWLGRYNGVAYFVLVGIALIGSALALALPLVDHIVDATYSLGWLLVGSTALSMLDRALGRRKSSH